jgi:hypothetical protein
MITPQQDSEVIAAIASRYVVIDEWALAEARQLEQLQNAGCNEAEARFVINADDSQPAPLEVN